MLYLGAFAAMIALRVGRVPGLGAALLAAMFIFVAFRFEVGCDWLGYYLQHHWVSIGSPLSQNMPPLWRGFIGAHIAAGLPHMWLNVTGALFFFAGLIVFGRRQADLAGFLILLFPVLIINLPMSALRQSVAMGIVMMALPAFIDKKAGRYLAIVVLATAVHSSAAIFLVIAPLLRNGANRQTLVMAGVLIVPAAIGLSLSGAFDATTYYYLDKEVGSSGGPFRIALLAATAILYFALLRPAWQARYPAEVPLADAGAILMLVMLPLLPVSTLIADRLGYYLIPIQAMILARIPFLDLPAGKEVLAAAPYVILLVFFGYYVFQSVIFEGCYTPYRSWLFGLPESRLDFSYYRANSGL